MNIFDPIERVAQTAPFRAAIISGQQVISYGNLMVVTAGIAQRFKSSGIKRGDVVVLTSLDPLAHFVLTLGLARLGAVSLPIRRGADLVKLSRICAAKAIVLSKVSPDVPSGDWLLLQDGELLASFKPGETSGVQTADMAEDEGFRYALSSGTTGDNKVMLWTHGGSRGNLELIQKYAPSAESDRVLMFMAMNINFTVQHSLRVLYSGAALILPTGEPSSGNMARHLELYGATQAITTVAVISGMVKFLRDARHSGNIRFPCLRQLTLGGEALPRVLLDYIEGNICSDVISNYGASEAGLFARSDGALRRAHPHATGRLLPGVQASAVDEAGMFLPAGSLGRLAIKAPGMVRGYEGDPALSGSTFRNGWYFSADYGSVDEEGVITLGSRLEEWQSWQGKRIDPLPIESVINSVPGVIESAVFVAKEVGSTQSHLVGLYASEAELPAAAILQLCREQLTADLVPTLVKHVKSLPRTDGGKVSRSQLSQRMQINVAHAGPAGHQVGVGLVD